MAHQPGTIELGLVKAAQTGKLSFLVDPKGKGDTKIQYLARNEDPDADVLLVFPACSFEGQRDERLSISKPHYRAYRDEAYRLDSLDAVLSGDEALPKGAGERRAAIWALCQQTKSFLPGVYLLKRGAVLKLQMSIDFRDPALLLAPDNPEADSFKIPIHSYFDIYAVDPDQSDDVVEALLAGRRPKAAVLASFLNKVDRGAADARQYFSLYYELQGNPRRSVSGTFRKTTYEDLFLPEVMKESPDEASGIEGAKAFAGSNLLYALEDYQTPKKILPGDALEYDPDHSDLYKIPTDSAGPEGETFCEFQEPRPDCRQYPYLCTGGQTGNFAGKTSEARFGAAIYNVTGRYSVKQTDHALHPAWGWRAVAWWEDGGTWRKLAEDWVQSDGSYSLSIDYSGYSGQNLTMQFRAYNRYYEPQDQNNNLYRWVNPQRFSISTSHDEGHWYADADGGAANGIGEMYRGAYALWSKAYWTGEFNPLRPNPVVVYTPNTWYDCELPLNVGAGGAPWSCASSSGSGQIWLTAAHSIDAEVVQHEFAHNVQNEFWNNRQPADCCGSHTLCGVFSEGLALGEGYANFMPAWVQCSSNNSTCNTGMGQIDTAICNQMTNRDRREGWVAMAFWDLFDRVSDGNDILWFNHPGAVHSIYFQNGPSSNGAALGITDMQTPYRNAASAGHETYIDDIFDQNVKN